MRRLIYAATCLSLFGFPLVAPAQNRGGPPLPPHAWLFGTWTGGLFPVNGSMTAQQCLAQPVVIFTKDLVLRATVTDPTLTQRVVATARAENGDAELRFASTAPAPDPGGLLGLQRPATAIGFGCENPDILHVRRAGENQISFPGCQDFPYPLIRCPSR